MTGDKSRFVTVEPKDGVVIFGDNEKEHIIGVSNIHVTPSTSFQNILLVDGLKHNLLSISQFCDKKFEVTFKSLLYVVSNPNDNGITFSGHRHDNIYMVDLDDLHLKNDQCLVAMDAKVNETSWLWHRRLDHASMDLLSKLIKKNLIKGLPKLNFEKNRIYDACQFEK